MRVITILIISLAIISCSNSKNSTCKYYFESCDFDAPKPKCNELISADSTRYITIPPISDLVARIDSSKKIMELIGPDYPFLESFKEAEDYWYYNSSRKMDGGWIGGSEGIIAIKDCAVLDEYTVIIYN